MENPSYYAVIPSDVRYDKNLSPNAKLLFAEISSLCNKNGVCSASNKYFSELYDVSTISISKWISQLASRGYIRTNMVYKGDSKEISFREIILPNGVVQEINRSEEKEIKHKEDIDFSGLLSIFNKITGKSIRTINDKAKKQFRARLREGYSKKDIIKAITNCHNDDYHKNNPKYLTPEFISRPDKLERYVNVDSSESSTEDLALKKRKELLKSMGI